MKQVYPGFLCGPGENGLTGFSARQYFSVVTPEEKKLFERAPERARKLFKQHCKMRREKQRKEFSERYLHGNRQKQN